MFIKVESIKYPGTGVKNGCEGPAVGTEPGSFARAMSTLKPLSHLSSPFGSFLNKILSHFCYFFKKYLFYFILLVCVFRLNVCLFTM